MRWEEEEEEEEEGGVVAPQSPQFHLAASSLMALTAESEVKCYQSLSHN